jgi:tRNA G46 methylase TrmB
MHPELSARVCRHLATHWRQPLHPPSVAAFQAVAALLQAGEERRLVLDSGCGTGASTPLLAQRHPGNVVLGLDRSAARLRQVGSDIAPRRESDVIWARVELASFWRLAVAAGWRCVAHYILYPNPWPKPAHLQRRWHAHPVFPSLLELGGALEVRSNWRPYVEEFALALELAGYAEAGVTRYQPDVPLTPFERKYQASGHALWCCWLRES